MMAEKTPDSFTIRRMRVAGYDLDVRTSSGNQPVPVVLVHGIGVSGRYFMPLARQLAADFTVYVIDMPGYGKTPSPPSILDIPELSDVTHELILALRLSRPVIAGHSMGCQVAARLPKKAPDLYKKLILLSPTVHNKERRVSIQALRLLQDGLHEPPSINRITLVDYYRMGLKRFLQTSRYMVNDRIEENLLDTTIPTLVVRGEKDPIVPRSWTGFLQSQSSAITVREVAGAAHGAHYEKPSVVADICRDFILS